MVLWKWNGKGEIWDVLVEVWQILDLPRRPIISVESLTEPFEPGIRPIDVRGGLFGGYDVFHHRKLLICQLGVQSPYLDMLGSMENC